ncbi:MAG: hypothetical protein ACFFAH_02130 [Promethearchaeota archaeon]
MSRTKHHRIYRRGCFCCYNFRRKAHIKTAYAKLLKFDIEPFIVRMFIEKSKIKL